MSDKPVPRDPRWIVLVQNGDYFTISRYREPDEADIVRIEEDLQRAATAGWLAIMGHSVYEAKVPELMMVRPLCGPEMSFEGAVKAFNLKLNNSMNSNN